MRVGVVVVLAASWCAACTESHVPPPTVLPLSPGEAIRIEIDFGGGATVAEARVIGGGGAAASGPFAVDADGEGVRGTVRLQVGEALTSAWLTLPFVADLDGQPNDEPRLDTTRSALAADGLRGIYLGDLAAGEARDVEVALVTPLGPVPARIALGGLLRADAGAPSMQVELEDAFRTEADGFYVSRNRLVFTGDGYAVVPAADEGSSRSATVTVPRAGRHRVFVRQISAVGDVHVELAFGGVEARLEGTSDQEWVDLGTTDLPAGDVPLALTAVGGDRLGLDALAIFPESVPAPPGESGLDAIAGGLEPAVAGASMPDAISSRFAPSARSSGEELRRALRVAMSLEPLPTEEPEHGTVDVVDDGPCSLELLWFDGGHGPVPANLYVPDDASEPLPAILNPIGHWSGGKVKEDEQLRAAGFCRLGFVSMSYDTYWQGERATPMDNHFLGTFDVLAGDSFSGMLHGEAVRAVSLLASRPEVDPSRIGVTGASGGGMVSAYLAAIDDRIAAAAPVVYTTDWEWLLLESLQGDPDQIPFGAALEAPLPDFWAGAIAPRPLLFISAEDDGIFAASVARRVFARVDEGYAAAGAPGLARLEMVPGGHGYGADARRLAFDFFLETLGGGGQVDELPDVTTRSAGELQVDPPGLRTLVDVHVERAEAIEPALDRDRLAEILTVDGAVRGPARPISPLGGVQQWALDVDDGREVSALVLSPPSAVREVVVVVADGGVAGATIVPWLLGDDRAVIVVEPTGIGSQMGPYSGVSDAGFGGHGKYAGGHPLLVGLTGMALLSTEVGAAAALARQIFQPDRVILCGEGLGSGAAVLVIAAADTGTFDAVVGVDGFASFVALAEWGQAPPPALLARDLFDVGDLPDLATLVAPRPVLLVSPRDATLSPLSDQAASALYPDAQLVALEGLAAALDGI